MARWYLLFRIVGYLGGLVGVILFMLGRQNEAPGSMTSTLGAMLLMTGFVSFVISYALYTTLQFRRRTERREELLRRQKPIPPSQ